MDHLGDRLRLAESGRGKDAVEHVVRRTGKTSASFRHEDDLAEGTGILLFSRGGTQARVAEIGTNASASDAGTREQDVGKEFSRMGKEIDTMKSVRFHTSGILRKRAVRKEGE